MDNIRISQVCGLCAGCNFAINTAINELNNGNKVTIFKEIVHNNNVNNYLQSLGAKFEDDINNLTSDSIVIIRAHGEPPKTYEIFNNKGITFKDCTCHNVKAIHNLVNTYYNNGYLIVIIGKYLKGIHPEVLGTMGWSDNTAILIENIDDVNKLNEVRNKKVYVVCQTTFNENKAGEIIEKIEIICDKNNCELEVNKSICKAQKVINEYSLNLAKESDIMIVVGGKKSSNSLELYNNVSRVCPSIFIEDIETYKQELISKNLQINKSTRVGITAGASTMKDELSQLKKLIEEDIDKM
jgi:4-hydroxy-3-methylbut-2-enyl diphosphate reductase